MCKWFKFLCPILFGLILYQSINVKEEKMAVKKVSESGLKEIISSESIRYEVYDDANGKPISSYSELKGYPTIGVGHRIKDNERTYFSKYLKGNGKLSKSQVMVLFSKDVPKYTQPVLKRINKPITQSMLDALVSLAYNAGPNAKSVKEATAKINELDYKGAAQAILNGPTKSKVKGKYVTRPGLVKRRKSEAKLFLKDGVPGSKLQKFMFWTGILAGLGAASMLLKKAVFGSKSIDDENLYDLTNRMIKQKIEQRKGKHLKVPKGQIEKTMEEWGPEIDRLTIGLGHSVSPPHIGNDEKEMLGFDKQRTRERGTYTEHQRRK